MGTYTTNYNLFMPSVGEQGWGDLVNENFSTIDTTMAGVNTRMGTAETNITSLTTRMGTAETTITSNTSRIGTLETESDALDSRIKIFEDNISFDSNGNIVGNLVGNVKGNVYGGTIYKPCKIVSYQTNYKLFSSYNKSGTYAFPAWSGYQNVASYTILTPIESANAMSPGFGERLFIEDESQTVNITVNGSFDINNNMFTGRFVVNGTIYNTKRLGGALTALTVPIKLTEPTVIQLQGLWEYHDTNIQYTFSVTPNVYVDSTVV